MEIQIRSMAESHVPAVSQIVSEGYADLARQEGFSAEHVQRLRNERSTALAIYAWLAQWQCFVTISDAGVVGALAIDQKDVGEIWVSRQHRGKGIGTALFQHAEQVIAEAGFGELTARCAAASVQRFYEAMGCEVVEVKPCPCGPLAGWPLTHYRKELKAQPTDPCD